MTSKGLRELVSLQHLARLSLKCCTHVNDQALKAVGQITSLTCVACAVLAIIWTLCHVRCLCCLSNHLDPLSGFLSVHKSSAAHCHLACSSSLIHSAVHHDDSVCLQMVYLQHILASALAGCILPLFPCSPTPPLPLSLSPTFLTCKWNFFAGGVLCCNVER